MYRRTAASSRPTVLTQYPVAQKCRPAIRRPLQQFPMYTNCTLSLSEKPIVYATLYWSGLLRHKWMRSLTAWPSNNPIPFRLHNPAKSHLSLLAACHRSLSVDISELKSHDACVPNAHVPNSQNPSYAFSPAQQGFPGVKAHAISGHARNA